MAEKPPFQVSPYDVEDSAPLKRVAEGARFRPWPSLQKLEKQQRAFEKHHRRGDSTGFTPGANPEMEQLAADVGNRDLSWWEKAFAAAGLGVGIAQGKIKGKPAPRKLDKLGFYSHLDETLGGFRPTDTVTAKTLAQKGVKEAEMQARGIWPMLEGGKAAKVGELAETAAANPVELREAKYAGDRDAKDRWRENAIDTEVESTLGEYNVVKGRDDRWYHELYGERSGDRGYVTSGQAEQALRHQIRDDVRGWPDSEFIARGYDPEGYKGHPPADVAGPAKWSEYSLDPSNPTYRESVLHLPTNAVERVHAELRRKYGPEWNSAPLMEAEKARLDEAHSRDAAPFGQGHFSEPNVIAHMRTSLQKDAQGRPVLLTDELQSDWGQKLREGGARDEAKIAAAKKAIDDAFQARLALAQRGYNLLRHVGLDEHMGATFDTTMKRKSGELDIPAVHTAMDWINDPAKYGAENAAMAKQIGTEMYAAVQHEKLKEAEHKTLTAATPGHPLVNSTDQWTTTAMRRLLQQAIESKAEGIAITPGQMQNERFNLSKHVDALAYDPGREMFYYRLPGNNMWMSASSEMTPDRLHQYVGKEMAQKLLEQPISQFEPGTGGGYSQGAHMLNNLGEVEIGGHGMRYAYDEMYPSKLAKMLKKMDPEHPGRGTTELAFPDLVEGQTRPDMRSPIFHHFPITPAVREAVAKGLPLFSAAGAIPLAGSMLSPFSSPDDTDPYAQ